MFAGRPFHCRQGALELRLGVSVPRRACCRVPFAYQSVTVKIVRVEDLLPPMNIDFLVNASLKTIHQLRGQIFLKDLPTHLRKLDSILHVQAHVAIHHDREIRAHSLSMSLQELDILPHPRGTLMRSVWQRHLSAPETHPLGLGRQGSRKVERNILLGTTADHLVDGLATDLAEEVPDGEVDDGDSGKCEALSAVEHGCFKHLR